MSFRKFLQEAPINLGDVTQLGVRNIDLDSSLDYLNTLNLRKKKLFDGLEYSIIEQYFIVFSKKKIIMYIRYSRRKNSMVIDVVENLSDIKRLQFKVLSFILEQSTLKFDEIITGDALSTQNIKSHKNYVKDGNFNLYVRAKKEDTLIDNEDDINKYLNDYNAVFVLKTSHKNKAIREMYNSNFSIVYDELADGLK